MKGRAWTGLDVSVLFTLRTDEQLARLLGPRRKGRDLEEQQALRWVEERIDEAGEPPTEEELAAQFDRSRSWVYHFRRRCHELDRMMRTNSVLRGQLA